MVATVSILLLLYIGVYISRYIQLNYFFIIGIYLFLRRLNVFIHSHVIHSLNVKIYHAKSQPFEQLKFSKWNELHDILRFAVLCSIKLHGLVL